MGDNHFRKLTLKMIGLSNMLSLMNVTKEAHLQISSSHLGGIHKGHLSMAESLPLLSQKTVDLEAKSLVSVRN
jgi:hypothetical protein